ncbi:DME family drug/metabolite transporter [Pseudonocardia hierapolitana]|uniref:DME family drug/metabolite transporter n=1 Tax=Pseudonocardia hierapolitana TaxID=1128676 RepID=A0A561SN94_9PSEU|nr:DMT family transporter [Pseudonocardia hierapolitana]TWF76331.1 DME family drug/metabolite transporter [Pseudonocardia hierapolitana]
MSTVRTTPSSGVSFLVLAGVLWGTGGLLGRLLADATGLSSLAVATYRLAVGGLLIVGYLLVTGARLPRSRAAWARITAVGALAALFQVSYFTAVSFTSVSMATLVTIGSSPVLVLLARPRSADGRGLSAVGLALCGLLLLVGVPTDGGPSTGAALAGAACALAAAAGFTAMSLLGARPVRGLDAMTTTGVGFAFGGALLAPSAVTTSGLTFAPTPASIGLLLVFGLVPTAVAYTCYFRGLRSAAAGVGVLMALLEPVTSAVLSAVLLGERLGAPGIAGGLLLCAALVLTARGQGRERSSYRRSA